MIRNLSFVISSVICLSVLSCRNKAEKGNSPAGNSTLGKYPSKITVVIHPQYVVTGTDTLFSQTDSSRLSFIGEKVSKLDSLRKIKLNVPYPPDTALVMPVVRILKPSGAEILITPYAVEKD